MVFLKIKDFSVSKEIFELHLNEELELLSTRPQPQNMAKYYESEAYISHTDSTKSVMDRLYQGTKKHNIKKKLALVGSYTNSDKTLLDIGAGTGDFLAHAKKQNWIVEGVEPNLLARQKAKEKGVPLRSNLEGLSRQKFKVITLWHVLEHLPNLTEQIEKITSLLQDNGVLVIAVPNFKSFDARYYNEFWAAYDVPRHLWHFSKGAIRKLFADYGLEMHQTKPMWFDAFYVSLLSEGYKAGKKNWLKAFSIGLWSNLSGIFTKEYSSHIYFLQKAI